MVSSLVSASLFGAAHLEGDFMNMLTHAPPASLAANGLQGSEMIIGDISVIGPSTTRGARGTARAARDLIPTPDISGGRG